MTRSVPDLATLDTLDDAEMLEGYRAGCDGDPEPGDNRSLGYWHGWRNGACDRGLREIDDEQRELARLVTNRQRKARGEPERPKGSDSGWWNRHEHFRRERSRAP